ncbi:MAG TPA: cytochrome c biogenesis protein CcsA [Thermoguttaceae bacterium]|nr:cytochrome c biogenesis protein CcsA [Thermoguttaceae bacterium]
MMLSGIETFCFAVGAAQVAATAAEEGGIGILCFGASYLVALALEISRLVFRSGVRGAVMLGFAGAGLVAHSAYLVARALETPGSPLSSTHDWCLVAAWALVVAYLYLVYYHPKANFGLFIFPLVLGLVASAAFFTDPDHPFSRLPSSYLWGIVHGTSILLGTVAVSIGFAAGLMYLGQARRLKHKRPPIRGLRLPSLEWLQRTNSRSLVISVLMLGVGVASGAILNLSKPDRSDRLLWLDPLVLFTHLTFTWLLVATVVGAFYRPARQGRKVAYLTLVSMVFLLLALGVMLFGKTQHGGEQGATGILPVHWRDASGTQQLCKLYAVPLSPSSLAPRPSSLAPRPSSLAPRPSPLAPTLPGGAA